MSKHSCRCCAGVKNNTVVWQKNTIPETGGSGFCSLTSWILFVIFDNIIGSNYWF